MDYHYAAIYIRKAFASTPLNSLIAKDVQKWEASILSPGKSVETVMKAHRLLKSAMTYAMEVDDIRKNPITAVKIVEDGTSSPQCSRYYRTQEAHGVA
jgi:hypothetical protein